MRLVWTVPPVGLAKELHPVMFHTIPFLCASCLTRPLAGDLHSPETVSGAVLPHVHPFPDCVLDMSDLEAVLHHLPHSQIEYYVTLVVYEVHQPGFAWSLQKDPTVQNVSKGVRILIHRTSYLDVLAYYSEAPSPQYSMTPNKGCCYCEMK
jgi:hypothetical protein